MVFCYQCVEVMSSQSVSTWSLFVEGLFLGGVEACCLAERFVACLAMLSLGIVKHVFLAHDIMRSFCSCFRLFSGQFGVCCFLCVGSFGLVWFGITGVWCLCLGQ